MKNPAADGSEQGCCYLDRPPADLLHNWYPGSQKGYLRCQQQSTSSAQMLSHSSSIIAALEGEKNQKSLMETGVFIPEIQPVVFVSCYLFILFLDLLYLLLVPKF